MSHRLLARPIVTTKLFLPVKDQHSVIAAQILFAINIIAVVLGNFRDGLGLINAAFNQGNAFRSQGTIHSRNDDAIISQPIIAGKRRSMRFEIRNLCL